MNLLLDTCTFLWVVEGSPHLSQVARELFADPAHLVYLSSVSAWEVGVKHRLGRLSLTWPPHDYVPYYRDLHRMLICQAIHHSLVMLTPDPEIHQYPLRVVW